MTDKEKIRAEVEMRLSHHLAFSGKFKGFKSMADEDKAILSFIDSLPEELAKFKIGDTIRPKGSKAEYTITSISGGCYHGKGWGLQIDAEKDYELVESAEDVDAQINSQNDAIKNLNSALNSMEHNGHLPKMMTAAESLGISEEEYAKIEDEFFKEQEETVRGDFEMALAEMIDKAQKCVVEPWVVAAQWKDELVKLAKECKAMQEHPKDCMYSKDNYTAEDRKILCKGCEEDCKYNKKEEPASDGMEKELPKVWDMETLDEYAYQVAYDLSNDWMKETPTWNDVETACKLGAEWKEKQMIELGMSVSNKVQKGESV